MVNETRKRDHKYFNTLHELDVAMNDSLLHSLNLDHEELEDYA